MVLRIAAKDFVLLVEYALAAEKERKTSLFEAMPTPRASGRSRLHNLPIAMTFDRNPSER